MSTPAYRGNGEFCFFGEIGSVRCPQGWNEAEKPKLWLYNLHYLDDLNSQGADQRQQLLTELIFTWTDDNANLSGNGWEPYPLSMRLVNLVKWYSRQTEVPDILLHSLARQAQALAAQIEWHILANHLFANGKALTFVGAFLSGSSGSMWLRKGLKILDRELPEQFLADGGHFELSPMYHATLIWDLCDLINLADRSGLPELVHRAPQWRAVVAKGIDWLRALSHPNGEIALFNDAALDVAPSPSAIERYAKRLGITSITKNKKSKVAYTHLAETGYLSVQFDPNGKAVLDVGQLGPSYQPGHAHADTLCFELSLYGQRVFVNSGTSVYADVPERLRQRGTGAHNTVEIDSQDSSEVWAAFRVARRARPLGLVVDLKGDDELTVRCAHDGYRWLRGAPRHTRKWHFAPGRLEVVDRIDGSFGSAVARLYLHPDIQVGSKNSLVLQSGQSISWFARGCEPTVVPATWHPKFGFSMATSCIELRFTCPEIALTLFWDENAYPISI